LDISEAPKGERLRLKGAAAYLMVNSFLGTTLLDAFQAAVERSKLS
jgi:hypothetical protein